MLQILLTPGLVDNIATTGQINNIANSLVLRDDNGNFNAGQVQLTNLIVLNGITGSTGIFSTVIGTTGIFTNINTNAITINGTASGSIPGIAGNVVTYMNDSTNLWCANVINTGEQHIALDGSLQNMVTNTNISTKSSSTGSIAGINLQPNGTGNEYSIVALSNPSNNIITELYDPSVGNTGSLQTNIQLGIMSTINIPQGTTAYSLTLAQSGSQVNIIPDLVGGVQLTITLPSPAYSGCYYKGYFAFPISGTLTSVINIALGGENIGSINGYIMNGISAPIIVSGAQQVTYTYIPPTSSIIPGDFFEITAYGTNNFGFWSIFGFTQNLVFLLSRLYHKYSNSVSIIIQ